MGILENYKSIGIFLLLFNPTSYLNLFLYEFFYGLFQKENNQNPLFQNLKKIDDLVEDDSKTNFMKRVVSPINPAEEVTNKNDVDKNNVDKNDVVTQIQTSQIETADKSTLSIELETKAIQDSLIDPTNSEECKTYFLNQKNNESDPLKKEAYKLLYDKYRNRFKRTRPPSARPS